MEGADPEFDPFAVACGDEFDRERAFVLGDLIGEGDGLISLEWLRGLVGGAAGGDA